MSAGQIAALVLVAVVLVGLIAALALRARRTKRLQSAFGSEYDRTVDSAGKRREAEKELQSRQQEHAELELRPLTPAARERFTQDWIAAQAHFVDTPAVALTEADALVTRLLQEIGYPTDDFETRTRLLSIEHNQVLDDYRAAHEVELASRARTADTETVRNAFLDFRHVFDALLGAEAYPEPQEQSRQI